MNKYQYFFGAVLALLLSAFYFFETLLVLIIMLIVWAIVRISKTKPRENVHQSTEFFREHREDNKYK